MKGAVVFCVHCGAGRVAGGAFCASCGSSFKAPLAGESAASPVDQTVTAQLPVTPVLSPPEYPRYLPAPPQEPRRGRRRIAVVAGAAIVAVAVGAGGILALQSHKAPVTKAVEVPRPVPTAAVSPTASATASPVGFSELYRQDSDGVIRIETTACDGGGVGSGFLLAPDLVATVAHVVRDAVSVVLRQGTTTTTGTVVGYDLAHELALVRTSVPLTGHVFTLATTQPDVGTDVAAIGYPLAGAESLSKGAVSGLDRPITTESGHLTGLIQTDTPINPGNSGGPLLSTDGTVVGLVEAKNTDAANIGYAVPSTTSKAQFDSWQANPVPVHTVRSCNAPTGPGGVAAAVTDDSNSPDGPDIASAFTTYVTGINTGDYASAYQVLTPQAQAGNGPQAFARGEASSYIAQLSIASVTTLAAGRDSAEVTFISVQDPQLGGTGQSCSTWHITYTLINTGGGWQIDRATPHDGSPIAC